MASSRLYLGDCLDVMRGLPDASVDAVVTDPPYSSGGFTRADRMSGTDTKYVRSNTATIRPNFSGDTRDQRSWLAWCSIWLAECRRIVKPGGYALVFTDWRQLPTLTDAFQCGGFQWRGLIAWDKTNGARAPHTGYFRHQCEYIVWGSNGPLGKSDYGGPWPGCVRVSVKQ
ncbi:MAG: DNA methyltransferase, partial [Isosphaeraceae bacterium]